MAPVPGRRSFVGPTLVLLAVLASLGFIALQLGSAGPAVGAASPAPSQRPAASLLGAASAGRPGPSGDGSPRGVVATPTSSDPSSPSASQSAAPQPPTADPSAPPTSAPPPALTLDPSVATRLQARLDTIRAKTGIPGVSAAIILADGSTWTGTSGLGYVKGKRFVTPETVFAIASASKTYLSAVTLQLVDEGRLGLDTPVLDYLPDQPIDRRITVRMLLDHTSGLSDFFLNPKIDKAPQKDGHRRWTSAEALGYMRDQVFKPGTGWHYSNTNYVVLGLLAERVTGLDLGSLFHQRLFGPLALTKTYYQPTDEPTGV